MDLLQVREWSYISDLPRDIGSIRTLLLDYSKVPDKDIERHLVRIVSPRDQFIPLLFATDRLD